MVRVQAKLSESTEEKKETTEKKKATSKKKAVVTGVWPCKINGCNKQFAREADLKRHQRTTKLHSMPGFACPQCDATFTRTDALRRHQKSRHNGVIIEPTEPERSKDGAEDAHSSGSKSRSHSETPSSKGKAKLGVNPSPTALAHPSTAGPSSYYRQHTVTNAFTTPHTQGAGSDTQYPQGTALPTSSARLHQANWPPPPPWATEGPSQMSYQPLPGQHPIYYQPSPYYRPNASLVPAQPHTPQSQINPELAENTSQNSSHTSPSSSASRKGTPSQNKNVLSANSSPGQQSPLVNFASRSLDNHTFSTAPVIDPSLDTTANTSTEGTKGKENAERKYLNRGADNINALSLKITQAAMEAVLESVRQETEVDPGTPDGSDMQDSVDENQMDYDSIRQPSEQHLSEGEREDNSNGVADGEDRTHITTSMINGRDGTRVYHTPLDLGRPEPMEHMLTEDGEPMLNPAELLTQESLASPPPS